MLRWVWSIEHTKGSNTFSEVGMNDRGLLARVQDQQSAAKAAELLSRTYGGKAVRMQGWRVGVFYTSIEPDKEFILSSELANGVAA